MQEDLAKRFGRRMKMARKERGLTGAAFAHAMDVSQQTVTNWESGKAFPAHSRLDDIAGQLGKPLDWFFRREGDQEAALSESVRGMEDLMERAREIYERLRKLIPPESAGGG